MNKDNTHILVVEDDEYYRGFFIKYLKREGYNNVTPAVNGREALELIGLHDFDAILLDIMMPEIDGHEVLEKLKANESQRDIPVIVL